MQVSKRVVFIVVVICIGIGAVIGSKWGAQIETQIVTKDRIVTQIKEVTRPDGTVIRDEVRVEDRQQTVIAPAKKDWIVGAGYGIAPIAYYGVSVHRRVIGDVYLGISGNTRGEAMASVLISF